MILKRIKKAWELSRNKSVMEADKLLPIRGDILFPIVTTESISGDGKAEFLGEGTIEEYRDQQEADKGFKKRLFGL